MRPFDQLYYQIISLNSLIYWFFREADGVYPVVMDLWMLRFPFLPKNVSKELRKWLFLTSSIKNNGVRVGWVPVHGQLSHQSDVSAVLAGRVLVLQEVQVHSVNRESLPTEVVALIVLVELLQSRLQLRKRTRHGSKIPLKHKHLKQQNTLRVCFKDETVIIFCCRRLNSENRPKPVKLNKKQPDILSNFDLRSFLKVFV